MPASETSRCLSTIDNLLRQCAHSIPRRSYRSRYAQLIFLNGQQLKYTCFAYLTPIKVQTSITWHTMLCKAAVCIDCIEQIKWTQPIVSCSHTAGQKARIKVNMTPASTIKLLGCCCLNLRKASARKTTLKPAMMKIWQCSATYQPCTAGASLDFMCITRAPSPIQM